MPSDFLRDVRTDDSARRSRRRLYLFPLSLIVHAAGALAYLIIPLAAEVTLPTPAPLFAGRHWVMATTPVQPAEPVLRASPVNVDRRRFAPTTAPSKIGPEAPDIPDGSVPGGLDGIGKPVGRPDVPGVDLPVLPTPPPVALPPAHVDRGPLKIGGAIRAPQRLAASAPTYPPLALSARVEGQVVLEALIDERGRVGSVRILTSVPLLDAAAVDAVRTWRYTPTLLNGVPVPVLMTVTVSFTLHR